MSIEAINWAFGVQHPAMLPIDRLFLLILADHANPRGYCWPSAGRIRKILLVGERHTRRIRDRLQAIGLLNVKYNGDGHAIGFNLNFRDLDRAEKTSEHDLFADLDPQPQGSPLSQNVKGPDSGVRAYGLRSPHHRTQESAKRTTNEPPMNQGAPESAPAAAPPAPRVVVSPAASPQPALPKAADLLLAWNAIAATSKLTPVQRPLTRQESVMLVQAIKHPALDGDIAAWSRYVGWIAQHPFFGGTRDGYFPAAINQAASAATIAAWAGSEDRDRGVPPSSTMTAAGLTVAEVIDLREAAYADMANDPWWASKVDELIPTPEIQEWVDFDGKKRTVHRTH